MKLQTFILLAIISLAFIANAGSGIGNQEVQDKADTTLELNGYANTVEKSGLIFINDNCLFHNAINQSGTDRKNSDGSALDVPANDDCANAEAIGDVQELTFTTEDATPDGSADYIITPNIWYLYTASSTGPIKVSTLGSVLDTKIAVYDGSNCIATEEPLTPTPLQGGDVIAQAASISGPLPAAYTGSLIGYSHDYELSEDCSSPRDEASDVVYSYCPATDTTINVHLECPRDSSDECIPNLALAIMDSNGGELACSGNFADRHVSSIINFDVESGQTYYFIVTETNNYSHSEYTLTISSPNYEMVACNDDYGIWYQAELGFDAIEGYQYLIEIGSGTSDQTGEGILSVGQFPSSPDNDNCENASIIGDGILYPGGENSIQFTGDNTGATIDCFDISDVPEVWLSFTTEETLDVTIDFCDSPTGFQGFNIYLTESCPCIYEDRIIGENDIIPWCSNPYGLFIHWLDLPPGTYYYPVLSTYLAEGPYAINISGARRQICTEDALYGQSPSMGYGDFYLSNIDSTAMAETFYNVTGAVNQVVWWGTNNTGSPDWSHCDTDSLPFQIVFCENYYGFPADTIAVYNDIDVLPEETGYTFTPYRNFQMKYVAQLDPPLYIDMICGWVIIRGNSNDCWFSWQSDGTGTAMMFDEGTNEWSNISSNLSLCLGYDSTLVDIKGEEIDLPSEFRLFANSPNPFNAVTTIKFELPAPTDVKLSIYNVLGEEVAVLASGMMSAGKHNIAWNASDYASGIYFYSLKAGDYNETNTMTLIK